jgi:hypothetical protein
VVHALAQRQAALSGRIHSFCSHLHTMSSPSSDMSILFAKIEQMHQQNSDERALVREQLSRLSQCVEALNVKQAREPDQIQLDHVAITCDCQKTPREHRHQRARIAFEQAPVLTRAEALDTVFSFVGIGEYYYVAGVCRNWRGRYIALCSQKERTNTNRFKTHRESIVATAARWQLALDNGLTIAKCEARQYRLARALIDVSLESMKVITLARLYGMQWNYGLTQCAAMSRKYELLKWLHKCGWAWDPDVIMETACDTSDDIEQLKQLHAITGPWPAESRTGLMQHAALNDALDTVKWCHEQGAEWPDSFYDSYLAPHRDCWSVQCAQWALANGSTWLIWRCQNLAPEHYDCRSEGAEHDDQACTCAGACPRKQAAELFKWAHENGCPCTCEAAAAAV